MQEEIDKWKRTEYMLKSIKFPRIRWTTFVHWNGPTANCSGHLMLLLKNNFATKYSNLH